MDVVIAPYAPKHHHAFRELNLEWLELYNLKESHDLFVLNDPDKTVLECGGFIWVALRVSTVVGTAALMKEHEGVYELAKMCVAPGCRGQGIGDLLISQCIEKARQLGARRLSLFSNDQLTAAIALYKKYRFVDVPVSNSPFETANIKMELVL